MRIAVTVGDLTALTHFGFLLMMLFAVTAANSAPVEVRSTWQDSFTPKVIDAKQGFWSGSTADESSAMVVSSENKATELAIYGYSVKPSNEANHKESSVKVMLHQADDGLLVDTSEYDDFKLLQVQKIQGEEKARVVLVFSANDKPYELTVFGDEKGRFIDVLFTSDIKGLGSYHDYQNQMKLSAFIDRQQPTSDPFQASPVRYYVLGGLSVQAVAEILWVFSALNYSIKGGVFHVAYGFRVLALILGTPLLWIQEIFAQLLFRLMQGKWGGFELLHCLSENDLEQTALLPKGPQIQQ